jgi:hypothetical protein
MFDEKTTHGMSNFCFSKHIFQLLEFMIPPGILCAAAMRIKGHVTLLSSSELSVFCMMYSVI